MHIWLQQTTWVVLVSTTTHMYQVLSLSLGRPYRTLDICFFVFTHISADRVKIADFVCAWVPSFHSPRLNSPTL